MSTININYYGTRVKSVFSTFLNLFVVDTGEKGKVLDPNKATLILRANAHPGSEIYFGIREDWFFTACEDVMQAQIWSTWGTPCIEIDGVKFDCYKTAWKSKGDYYEPA